jgi:hypothetical protein
LVTENDIKFGMPDISRFRYCDSRLAHLSETGEVVPVLALFMNIGQKSENADGAMPWNTRPILQPWLTENHRASGPLA